MRPRFPSLASVRAAQAGPRELSHLVRRHLDEAALTRLIALAHRGRGGAVDALGKVVAHFRIDLPTIISPTRARTAAPSPKVRPMSHAALHRSLTHLEAKVDRLNRRARRPVSNPEEAFIMEQAMIGLTPRERADFLAIQKAKKSGGTFEERRAERIRRAAEEEEERDDEDRDDDEDSDPGVDSEEEEAPRQRKAKRNADEQAIYMMATAGMSPKERADFDRISRENAKRPRDAMGRRGGW